MRYSQLEKWYAMHLIPEIELIDIKLLKKINYNQEKIDNKRLLKIVSSIKSFPEMLYIRPIVVDFGNNILGGNLRYEACKYLNYSEVPIIKAVDLTEVQKSEFIILDNINYDEEKSDSRDVKAMLSMLYTDEEYNLIIDNLIHFNPNLKQSLLDVLKLSYIKNNKE